MSERTKIEEVNSYCPPINHWSEGGYFPSTPYDGNPIPFPDTYSIRIASVRTSHPWLDNVQQQALMLKGKIKIPHLSIHCEECKKAWGQRIKYRREIRRQERRRGYARRSAR